MSAAAAPASAETERSARIRELNDALRTTGRDGLIMITPTVAGWGRSFTDTALDLVRRFSAFSPENDPYGEHDFGMVVVRGERLFWKIDSYDLTLTRAPDDPLDPSTCVRVLTLMAARDY